MTKLKSLMSRLRSNSSGNAALIVALGMPVLIGGAGYAVDTAQWYAWQRELQFATDQAAISAAWARTNELNSPRYVDRAEQEFANNLSVTEEFASDPEVDLADYNGGNDNSVIVTASATANLPFSNFLTGNSTTVTVRSQAQFEEGGTYTSCVIATDLDDDGAITLQGNAKLTAACGMAALSKSATAIVMNGNPEITAGYILAAGGIDQGLENAGDNELLANQSGLYDPFEKLTPPDDSRPRTYSCVSTGKGKDKVEVATLLPGTYSEIDTSCDTVMSGGIYVIDGGPFKVNAQHNVVGNGVMFVLKNGSYIEINGGANINLTAMTVSELIGAGVAADEADDLAGMLVFEDRENEAKKDHKINGNASTILNGKVYLPSSHVTFSGTAGVTSQCFMIAASTITIAGNANMTSFCPPGLVTNTTVANTKARVRLVA